MIDCIFYPLGISYFINPNDYALMQGSGVPGINCFIGIFKKKNISELTKISFPGTVGISFAETCRHKLNSIIGVTDPGYISI